MLSIKTGMLFPLVFIFGPGTVSAQTPQKTEQDKGKVEVTVSGSTGKKAERLLKEAERRGETRGRFFDEDRRCRSLIKDEMLKAAETVCKAAVRLAEQLEPESKLERIGAYESVGHVMIGQERYQEALDSYTRALHLGQAKLTDDSAQLARLYGDVAIAQHLLGDLDKALELYRKSEQIYQRAYTTFGEGETDEWAEKVRQSYLNALKEILKYHLVAAKDAGALSEIEEIEKLIKSLP